MKTLPISLTQISRAVLVMLLIIVCAAGQTQDLPVGLDRSFGTEGKVLTPFSQFSSLLAVALQADGKIIQVGFSADAIFDNFNKADFALVRYEANTLPGFSLSPDAPVIETTRGTSIKVKINIARLPGFSDNVMLTPPDTSALKIRVKQEILSTKETSASFTLKIKPGALLGTHDLVFIGRDSGGREDSVTIRLLIR